MEIVKEKWKGGFMKRRAVIAIILSLILAFGSLVSVFAASYGMIWSDTGYEKKFVFYYDKNTKDDYTTTSTISKLTIEGDVAFCIQAGKMIEGFTPDSSGTADVSYTKATLDVSDKDSKANKVSYLGYYANSKTKKNYAYTQMYLYEIFDYVYPSGNKTAEFTSSSVQNDYEDWKDDIDDELAEWDTYPSFDYSTKPYPTTDIEAGETITLTDSNKALSNYSSFTYTKNGITVKHTAGSNSLTVTASSSVSVSNVIMYENELKNAGCEKWESGITMNYSYSSDVSQNLRVFGATDPLGLSLSFNVASTSIEFAKVDSETGKTIKQAGTQFKLVSSDGTFSSTYTTGSDGTVETEKLYAGTYYVTEVKAPSGYVLSDETVKVVVSDNGGDPITVEFGNDNQMGQVEITKIATATDGDGVEYTEYIKECEFEIFAREDIVTPDGTVRYSKGDVVDTVITGEDGTVWSDMLYLGAYSIREINVPTGFVLSDEVRDFDLEYAGQDVEVVYGYETMENNHQMGQVEITKIATATDGNDIEYTEYIADCEFEIFAREDIVTPNGQVLYNAGDVVEAVTTGEGGTVWSKELYLGAYSIREINVPYGFVLSDEIRDFNLEYAGQDVEVVYGYETMENDHQMGVISIQKTGTYVYNTEYYTENLAYVKFNIVAVEDIFTPYGQLLYSEGDIVDTVITDEDGKASSKELYLGTYDVVEVEYLAMKTTYTLTENDVSAIMSLYTQKSGIGEITDLTEQLNTKVVSETNGWWYLNDDWLNDKTLTNAISEYVANLSDEQISQELVLDEDDKYEFPTEPLIATVEFTYEGQDIDVIYKDAGAENYAQKGWAEFFMTMFDIEDENSYVKTGDYIMIGLLIGLMIASLVGASIILKRRREEL